MAVIATRLWTIPVVATLLCSCSIIVDPVAPEFKPYGDRCQADGDCESGICNRNRCSVDCSNNCNENAECRDNLCYFLSPPALDDPPNVALILVDEIDPHGVNRSHEDGREVIDHDVDNVSSAPFENETSSSANSRIDALVDDGFNIIVGTNATFDTAVNSGARNYPDVNFLVQSTSPDLASGPNIGLYAGRMYQVTYLMGNLAQRVTETNRIGIVAPQGDPEPVRNINAFALGAQAAAEELGVDAAEVVVRWINIAESSSLEPQATQELIDMECDVIMGLTRTSRPLEAIASKSTPTGATVYGIGYGDADACELVATRCLTSAFWNWGPLLVGFIEEMVTGDWQPDFVWEQIQGDTRRSAVYFSTINNVSATTAFAVETLVTPLAANSNAGRMLPFRGPIFDTSGTRRINASNYPTDDNLRQMCYHVQGVFQIDDEDPPGLEPAEVPLDCRGDR